MGEQPQEPFDEEDLNDETDVFDLSIEYLEDFDEFEEGIDEYINGLVYYQNSTDDDPDDIENVQRQFEDADNWNWDD